MEHTKEYYNKQLETHWMKLWERLGVKFTKTNFYEKRTEASNWTYSLFYYMSEALAARPDDKKPSELITEKYQGVLDAYVPAHKQKDALYYIDSYHKMCYSEGSSRRTVHSEKRKRIPGTVLEKLFESYYNLTLFCGTMEEYILGKVDPEVRERDEALGYYMKPTLYQQDSMIAAEIDRGETGISEALNEILLSESNTAFVTVPMIRGIVKSGNTHLHKILGDFLLAARLQEGVRQAICENADCGTKEAFLSILKVIVDNQLNRYSAVKRAVATWTGICSEENLERISDKLLALIDRALRDGEYRKQLITSNDSMELYIGLWAVGFYEAADTVELIQNLIRNGTKNQKLTASYYNLSLYEQEYAKQSARYVIETWPEDVELAAAYFPGYMPGIHSIINSALFGEKENHSYYYYGSARNYTYDAIRPDQLFDSREQAERHYELLMRLYSSIPKKGLLFSPCIFPWYSVELNRSDVLVRLCVIAYALDDADKLDAVCLLLPEVSTDVRCRLTRLLLHDPKTRIQREALLQAVADKETYTRKEAFEIVKELQLNREDYRYLAGELKFKAGDIRKNVLDLLEKQPDGDLYACIEELLASKKEELRAGGLDLIVRTKKSDARKELYAKSAALAVTMADPTDKEKIIISELKGGTEAEGVLGRPGYGLYDPAVSVEFPEWKADPGLFKNAFTCSQEEMYRIFGRLEELLETNKNLEYKSAYGEECLLGNGYLVMSYDSDRKGLDRYPYPELFRNFYREEIRDFRVLMNLFVFLKGNAGGYLYGRIEPFRNMVETLCGRQMWGIDLRAYPHSNLMGPILTNLFHEEEAKHRAEMRELSFSLLAAVLELASEETYYTDERYKTKNYGMNCEFFSYFTAKTKQFLTDEEFRESFLAGIAVNKFYQCNAAGLQFDWYVKAYTLGMMPLDPVYQMLFEQKQLPDFFNRVKLLVSANPKEGGLSQFAAEGVALEENPVFQTAKEMYWKIVDMILTVELKRSEADTPFSYAVGKIYRIRGMKYFVEILTALGNDTFDRSVYYRYNFGSSRKECLSALLYASEPHPGEDGKLLKKLCRGKQISERRLIEAAMYAPVWVDAVEECLGIAGLKSGIYYFSAHMNERFDDRKAAVIAKYTPLEKEDLIAGAFDVTWFHEVLGKLGDKTFGLLYDSAKYISDGNKHTRARKYADAAQGKVSAAELKAQIADKRNKDLLMSYPLVPIKDDKDLMERYAYIQQFLKESKQFGAQRKASEGQAARMAMINLAAASGYEDVTRLTLNMETKFVETMGSCFEWQSVGDTELRIEVDAMGKAELVCRKDGKLLKSVPSRLAKNETVLERKETVKQLREQYRRTKQMLEQFMEDETVLTGAELLGLMNNPVVKPLLRNLVYIYKDSFGFLDGRMLVSAAGKAEETGETVKAAEAFAAAETFAAQKGGEAVKQVCSVRITAAAKLKIAHPYHLWKAGVWADYQKALFERSVKQPFKQVFRELYVKTDEELDRNDSLRYAGNQIQPAKTVACLKSRRWVADYEDGLQKIYYKENIVARIYAQADWFSPGDIEAPTLEWVEFTDRKTYKPIKIKDVPDIVFSEVMRDVDLAVSVAHAGGVDPETSHSTMEMRKAIIEFNLPLFGLTNVAFAGNHALIRGKRASYTIHLGSGIIFQQGGPQIAVLPVHSQHRGKLFLPFVDEDPKTAEIMSKIVLFAEDEKIRDPYILEQILG